MKNCDQFRELIEAYALGALDPEDRAALEAHLATGCADCAKAVEEARWLVSQLAYAAPEAAPSDMLKGRLMQTVRAEAQSQAKPHVMPAKSAIPFWLWAGVAALLVFSIYSAWNTRRLEDEIRESNERAAVLTCRRPKNRRTTRRCQARSHDHDGSHLPQNCSLGRTRTPRNAGSQMAFATRRVHHGRKGSDAQRQSRSSGVVHSKEGRRQADAFGDGTSRCQRKTNALRFRSARVHGQHESHRHHRRTGRRQRLAHHSHPLVRQRHADESHRNVS